MFLDGKGRRFLGDVAPGASAALGLTPLGSVATASVEPERMEMSRAGRRFVIGNNAAITGQAPVQAHPTTVAQWVILNRASRESLVFEELGVYLESGTPGVGGTLLCCIAQTPSQVATANHAGVGIASASGSQRASSAAIVPNITITQPAAPVWFELGSNSSANVTAFAASASIFHRDLRGGIIVPPGFMLGLAVVAPAGSTPLYAPMAMFLEIALELE